MKYNSKKVLIIIAMIYLIVTIAGNSFAHSGKTDQNGGHKDNKNKSGLGSYHYHCGGHPAHLHDNGVCPYSYNSSSSKSSTSKASSKSSSSESVTTSSSVETKSTEKTIIKALSIKINENVASMKVGETKQLTASITPENTEDKSIIWTSDDEDIATVSSSGKVVALKAGIVNITVTTSNGKKDTISITIEKVKEIKEENNTIVAPIQNNKLNTTNINTTENSDASSGVLGLGIIGGGGYLGYKKYKKSRNK